MAKVLLTLPQGLLSQHPLGGFHADGVKTGNRTGVVPDWNPATGKPANGLFRAGRHVATLIDELESLPSKDRLDQSRHTRIGTDLDERLPECSRMLVPQGWDVRIVVDEI
ncbi:hypothetical protein [Methylorubrum populi]